MAPKYCINLDMVPNLERLWVEEDIGTLRCLECGQNFTTRTLIRTFRLSPPDSAFEEHTRCSGVIQTHLQQDVILFDRHLECLHSVEFFAISHVWDPEVSLAQQLRSSPQPIEVRRVAVEKPMRIYHGLEACGAREVWHDYLSVPQWNSVLKARILPEIHRLFGMAYATVVVFEDLSPNTVHRLKYGTTSEERLKGLLGVCKAKWFQRMWTAMELVRSHKVRMMTGNYQLVNGPEDPAFLGRIHEVWNQELKKYLWVHDLEHKARSLQLEEGTTMSNDVQSDITKGRSSAIPTAEQLQKVAPNLIPWELGPLKEIKRIKIAPFAMATALLSKRRCRDELDFLYALRGIIRAPSAIIASDVEFSRGFALAARDCLLAGDCSPLIMTPAITMPDPRLPSWNMFPTSFNDVYTWELGEEVHPASNTTAVYFEGEIAVLHLERIGSIRSTQLYFVDTPHKWPEPAMHSILSRTAALTLENAGPDIDDFVSSLSTRLFGLPKEASLQQLRHTASFDKLQRLLRVKYATSNYSWDLDGTNSIFWLSETIGLSSMMGDNSETPLGAMHGRYGTIHCYPYAYVCTTKCDNCSKTSMLRIGSFIALDELVDVVAFRIPGLQYLNSLRDGVGILVKDRRVVGRFIWGVPTCDCRFLETVRVQMPNFLLPTAYGRFEGGINKYK